MKRCIWAESEAIALAREVAATRVLLDDQAARRKARALGLRVTGTLGVLLMGKTAGYLPALKPLLAQLQQLDFRFDPALYTEVLTAAGEV